MRRASTIAVAAGLVLAACSGDDTTDDTTADVSDPAPAESVAPDDDPDADPDDDPDAGDADPDVTAPPADGTAPPAGDDEVVALPGLLDPSDDPIPNDELVVTGQLDNGIRYYVRENDNPGAKADLRLAVRAGSADEFGPSTGLAHFAEHMLFNGTEQFPENELIDVLRSFGASFGPDVNAYTSYDETVYSLVVPNDEQTVELGLTVLDEWLTATTFDPAQVESERGVVLDEWRIRTQTSNGRLFEQAADLFLDGTPYDGRMPIGTADSISNMDADELVEFYDAWYRPDNVAIVVVGDIDTDEIEADLERIFGDAEPRSAELRERADRTFDTFDEADVRLHLDPDQRTVDVEVTLPLPAFESEGDASLRADLIDEMIFSILVQRLDRDVAEGTAPFDDVSPGTNSIVTGLDAPALYAFTDADRAADTLTSLLDEYQRTAEFGFTQDELDTARDNVAAFFRTRFDGRDSTQDVVYADQYVEHFLRGTPYPSIDDEFAIVSDELDGITTDALAARFDARWANAAPQVIISAPESVADALPTESEVLEIVAATGSRPVDQRDTLRDLPDEPMAQPEPVEPLSIQSLIDGGYSFFDPIELIYPNGVRVRLNPNQIVTGQIYMQASSPGGSSLLTDDDVVDALYAADIVTTSGVAEFNQAELSQILTGTDVEVGAFVSPYTENFLGSSATADAETMFQLLHLYMTAPRVDQVAVNQLIASEGPVVADPGIDPGAAENDALVDTRYDDELRYTVLPSDEQFATLDIDGVERVWNERYGDAGDWTFVFSGDFDVDELIELSSSYLGTLPGTRATEQPIDVSPAAPTTILRTDVVAGTGDTASVSMLFTSEVDSLGPSLTAHADVVSSLVSARLTDVVREQLGDTYSPYIVTYPTTDPEPVVETYVNISGSPDRIGQIAELVVAELDDLATNGPTDGEFANAFAQIEERYNFVDNGQFLDALINDSLDPGGQPVTDYLEHFFALDGVTAASAQAYIAEHMPTTAFVQVTVTPRG
ncbi:zinc protease [Ilumatobacter fluminis]|uniref:Zinc protease n=1 Tax=Ilumatobacter fluminis TaxID=467091 RepID=A0A4R7I4J4_9ACTN|nr:insulinase family protein [Ilumatobacter fluminis]TDT17889.1 zinc protease [Ilumatobacter fluminis]